MAAVLIFNHIYWILSLLEVNHSWQKCCHRNNLGYCKLQTISNDALYDYTKSQKVSSACCKLF